MTNVRARLADYAPKAADAGDHARHREPSGLHQPRARGLLREAGPNVGITFDTGNTFPVAEAPLDFTRVIAAQGAARPPQGLPVQFTDEGYRLVRCAIGDGAVPFQEMLAILAERHETPPAVLEPGALEARHVRLFTPDWWKGYAPKSARGACRLPASGAT